MAVPHRLHQEDFSQALGIAAANKYEKNKEGYMKMLFDVIRSYSSEPLTDALRLWDICVFNYLIGNNVTYPTTKPFTVMGADIRNARSMIANI